MIYHRINKPPSRNLSSDRISLLSLRSAHIQSPLQCPIHEPTDLICQLNYGAAHIFLRQDAFLRQSRSTVALGVLLRDLQVHRRLLERLCVTPSDSEPGADTQSLGTFWFWCSVEFQSHNLLSLVHLNVPHTRVAYVGRRWFDIYLKPFWKRNLQM